MLLKYTANINICIYAEYIGLLNKIFTLTVTALIPTRNFLYSTRVSSYVL